MQAEGPTIAQVARDDGIVLRMSVPEEVRIAQPIPISVSLSNGSNDTIRHWKYPHAPLELHLKVTRSDADTDERTRRGRSVLGEIDQGSRMSVSLGPGETRDWQLDLREYYDLAPGVHVVRVSLGVASPQVRSREFTVSARLRVIE